MGLGRGWALAARLGQVGPSRTEQGRLGLSGVGEGLGMHWDSNYSKTRPWGQGFGQVGPRGAGSGLVGPSRAG